MQGDLLRTNIAELLMSLYQSARTGILRLTQGDVKKGIYFKDGSIVFAHSNVKSDRLGETLLRLGKITEEEFQTASGDVIDRGKRLGRTLHEKGFLSPAEVSSSVSYQVQQIAYSIFNWDHGEYEFIDRERPVYEDIMVDISTPDLLIEGILHITNLAVLENVVGKDDSLIVERERGMAPLPRRNLDFTEETILNCLGDKASLARLRSLSHFTPLEFGRAIHALLISGMIHLRAPTAEEKLIPEPPSEKKRSPALPPEPVSFSQPKMSETPSRQVKTYSEAEMRQLIEETASRFRDLTDEEVLGVLPDATQEEIQTAYDRQIATFHPPLYSEERYAELKEKLKFISERLASSYDHLLEKAAARMPFGSQVLQVSAVPAVPLPAITHEESPHAEPMHEPTATELETQLNADPSNTGLMRLLAKRLVKEGRPREGEKSLLRALEMEPQSVETHFALAEFYQSLGLKLQAFKHLNIVLQLDPKNQRAMELLDIKKRKPLYEITRET